MKVIMIGTPTCVKCKNIAPKLETYCKEHNIEYKYIYLNDAPSSIVKILVSNNVTQAPAFIIEHEGDIRILSGDEISLEFNLF